MIHLPYYTEMNRMEHITLDGRKMQDKDTVHQYLKTVLYLDEYYGNNLDALWDALSTSHHPLEIRLIYREEMLEQLGSYGESIIKVFEDVAEENQRIVFRS